MPSLSLTLNLVNGYNWKGKRLFMLKIYLAFHKLNGFARQKDTAAF